MILSISVLRFIIRPTPLDYFCLTTLQKCAMHLWMHSTLLPPSVSSKQTGYFRCSSSILVSDIHTHCKKYSRRQGCEFALIVTPDYFSPVCA